MKYEFIKSDALSFKGFCRMPNTLFDDPTLSQLSNDAKILVTWLLDRVISDLYGLIDTNGHRYYICTTADIMETIHITKNTVTKRLDELENAGLIECPERAKGKRTIKIYVKDFFTSNPKNRKEESQKMGRSIPKIGKEESQKMGNSSTPNNIYINNQTIFKQTTTDSDVVVDEKTRELFRLVPGITDTGIKAVVMEAQGDLSRCQQAIASIPPNGVVNAVGFLRSAVRNKWEPPVPIRQNDPTYRTHIHHDTQNYDFDALRNFIASN